MEKKVKDTEQKSYSKTEKTEEKSVKTAEKKAEKAAPKTGRKAGTFVPPKKGWKLVAYILGLLVWTGVCLIAAQVIIAVIFTSFLPKESLTKTAVNTAYQAVTFAVCLVMTIGIPWGLAKVKTSRDELGLRGLPTWTDIGLGVIGIIVALMLGLAATWLVQLAIPQCAEGSTTFCVDWSQDQDVGFNDVYTRGDMLLTFVSLVIVAPICEEIIFRGWLYGKMRSRLTAPVAMLLTSLLFGLMHGQINVGLTVFVMSLVMCLIRELTGTIYGGIIVHMLKNGLAFYLLYVVGLK